MCFINKINPENKVIALYLLQNTKQNCNEGVATVQDCISDMHWRPSLNRARGQGFQSRAVESGLERGGDAGGGIRLGETPQLWLTINKDIL